MTEGTWEDEAEDWVAWVRAPGHDSYWYYSPQFFDDIVPKPGQRTLDVGCGEGRVARDLVKRGHRVVGIDSSPTLLTYARNADAQSEYLLADAAVLPFPDRSFDLAVAYNSLMDVDDMPGAVAEAARVLEAGGRLCVSITHPVNDAGSFGSREPDAPFVIEKSYFGRRRFDATFERAGLTMTFHGWCYPLEAYGRALEACGLVIDRLREPPAPDAIVEHDPAAARWRRVPVFLQFRARKV